MCAQPAACVWRLWRVAFYQLPEPPGVSADPQVRKLVDHDRVQHEGRGQDEPAS